MSKGNVRPSARQPDGARRSDAQMSAVLRWVEGPDDSAVARLGRYRRVLSAIPVLDDYQLVLAAQAASKLLGTHQPSRRKRPR